MKTLLTYIIAAALAFSISFFGLKAVRSAFAQIEGRNVDVALILAIDHSSSVDDREWKLQLDGYAAALRSESVGWSAFSGRHKQIAVYVFEWGGQASQRVILPWTIAGGVAGLERIAVALENYPRSASYDSTSITGAMVFAEAAFIMSPYIADRMILDISGDGPHNAGPDPEAARQRLIDMGVTINGLPILAEEKTVVEYYQNRVIGGRSAFLSIAEGWQDFANAVQRKLELELAYYSPIPGGRP
jgi:hypothetical protein